MTEWLLVKEQAKEELKKYEDLNFEIEVRIRYINNKNLDEMKIITDEYLKLMRERTEPDITRFKRIYKNIVEMQIITDEYLKLIRTKYNLIDINSNMTHIKTNLENIINNTDKNKYKMWHLNNIKIDIVNKIDEMRVIIR
jgi:hypothetical protein